METNEKLRCVIADLTKECHELNQQIGELRGIVGITYTQDQADQIHAEGYREGRSSMREEAARVADNWVCGENNRLVVDFIRAIPTEVE